MKSSSRSSNERYLCELIRSCNAIKTARPQSSISQALDFYKLGRWFNFSHRHAEGISSAKGGKTAFLITPATFLERLKPKSARGFFNLLSHKRETEKTMLLWQNWTVAHVHTLKVELVQIAGSAEPLPRQLEKTEEQTKTKTKTNITKPGIRLCPCTRKLVKI